MRKENKAIRQEQIEQAAYALLHDKGFAGTSMLSIAKRSSASNETLYNWYGDKLGLFRALVAHNAEETRSLLETSLAEEKPALDTLRLLGPKLLSLLTGERAITLNRAAAADSSGELGRAISEAGRETVAPLIREVLENARDVGTLSFTDSGIATELYINLLVGDLQIRRVIGQMPEPDAGDIAQRSKSAFTFFCRLMSNPGPMT